MSLKKIDFSNGIRSTEINENFGLIKEEIAEERLSITGPGTAKGLDLILSDRIVTVSAGDLVTDTGMLDKFEAKSLIIDLPILEKVDESYIVNKGNYVTLNYLPYSSTRLKTVEAENYITDKMISASLSSDSNVNLPISRVEGNRIYFASNYSGQYVKVSYYHTSYRYDTIYINNNLEIAVAKGTTSEAANKYIPSDLKYTLGYVYINPYGLGNNDEVSFTLIKNTMQFRNVYTDDRGILYINGIPMTDLSIIHIAQPVGDQLKDNVIWLDVENNLLKSYDKKLREWININDTAYINKTETYTWGPIINEGTKALIPDDRQTFLFDTEELMKMRFTPGDNSVTVYLDNQPLHQDQFEEISDPDLDKNQNAVNKGIGIRFADPLDEKDHYIEIHVDHKINVNNTREVFKRYATFTDSDSIQYTEAKYPDKIFSLDQGEYYSYKEQQLEVFVNGQRLRKTQFEEGVDLDLADKVRGTKSRSFKVISDIHDGDWISYKITKSIYTYDNFEMAIQDFVKNVDNTKADLEAYKTSTDSALESLTNKNTVQDDRLTSVEEKSVKNQDSIVTINNTDLPKIRESISEKIGKSDKITTANFNDDILSTKIVNGFIQEGKRDLPTNKRISVTNLKPTDYLVVYTQYDLTVSGVTIPVTKILERNVHYNVSTDTIDLSASGLSTGSDIYISGVRIGIK